MSVLLIGEKEKAKIAAAIKRARKHAVPLDFVRRASVTDKPVLKLADRKPGMPPRPSRPEEVLFPIGYRACVSFEEQPEGVFLHLSISVERVDPGYRPSVESVMMIARAFDIDFLEASMRGLVWEEEYEPGRYAVNILKLVAPGQVGHA